MRRIDSPAASLLRAFLLYSFVFECSPAPLISVSAVKAAQAARHPLWPSMDTQDELAASPWLNEPEVAEYLVRLFTVAA